jgi:hypothetical protein
MTDSEKKDNIDLKIVNNGLEDDDFVYTQVTGDDGSIEIVGGGYKVNSFFMKAGIPIMTTTSSNGENDLQSGGKKVSSPFENLAVPAGLFYVNQRVPKQVSEEYKPHEMIPDNIFDKLYALVDANKKPNKKTRKNMKKEIIKSNKRQTKRNME